MGNGYRCIVVFVIAAVCRSVLAISAIVILSSDEYQRHAHRQERQAANQQPHSGLIGEYPETARVKTAGKRQIKHIAGVHIAAHNPHILLNLAQQAAGADKAHDSEDYHSHAQRRNQVSSFFHICSPITTIKARALYQLRGWPQPAQKREPGSLRVPQCLHTPMVAGSGSLEPHFPQNIVPAE